MRTVLLVIVALSLSRASAFGQLVLRTCDPFDSSLQLCAPVRGERTGAAKIAIAPIASVAPSAQSLRPAAPIQASDSSFASPEHEGFHWGRALEESLTFLAIEQAYVVHTDFSWVVSENGIPFNHFWRDYTQSLSAWTHSGWNDGDPNWYGYVGHPIQGALTGFIQIQNDPQGEKLEFSKTKAYWWSRLKAGLWNAAYSTQWNLGPVSEVTVEKYGTKDRPPWNHDGSFPCSHHCLTGVGQIDIVMTPLGGTGWLIGEDFLDKELVRRVEDATTNRLLIDTVRCALNPIRGGANILHGEHPWYRASRDFKTLSFKTEARQGQSISELPKAIPDHGEISFGFSHMGGSRCQTPITNHTTTCDAFSNGISDLSGWNTSVETKYLRYFGAVADFSRQYGNASENDFLFGIRGGASIARFRPFAELLLGAVQENRSTTSLPDTAFAEALGAGVDLRLMRVLGWRIQADEVHTQITSLQQNRLRLSSGMLIRF